MAAIFDDWKRGEGERERGSDKMSKARHTGELDAVRKISSVSRITTAALMAAPGRRAMAGNESIASERAERGGLNGQREQRFIRGALLLDLRANENG